jgi:hypothetical protein
MHEACEAAQQCIEDLLDVYTHGCSMLVLDEAVKSLRDDALRKIKAALPKPTAAFESPKDIVLAAMADVLPAGVPLSFTVTKARFDGKGVRRVALADVIMFDEQPARLKVWRLADAWAHEWLELPAGPVSWERGQWVRIQPANSTCGSITRWRFSNLRAVPRGRVARLNSADSSLMTFGLLQMLSSN